MKNLVTAFLVLFSTFAFSQDFRNTRFGLTGGLNYSRVRFAHNPSGPIYTFQAGLLAEIPIDEDDQFYLQPEVTYYGAGESGKDKEAKGAAGYNAVYATNYISVPVYFKGFFSENESEFFALFGPRFNFLLNQKLKNVVNPQYTLEGVDYPGVGNVNGKANKFAFALGFGIGYSYKRKMELALKYDMGFSNVYPNLNEQGTRDPNVDKKKKEHVLSVGLNYIFD